MQSPRFPTSSTAESTSLMILVLVAKMSVWTTTQRTTASRVSTSNEVHFDFSIQPGDLFCGPGRLRAATLLRFLPVLNQKKSHALVTVHKALLQFRLSPSTSTSNVIQIRLMAYSCKRSSSCRNSGHPETFPLALFTRAAVDLSVYPVTLMHSKPQIGTHIT